MTSGTRSGRSCSVVHLNIADFAAAVQRRADRRLEKNPLIISSRPGGRAAVYDMSEEAYQAGVRKAMPLAFARGICGDALVLPPDPALYARAMEALFREVCEFSPLVEAGETDGHFFVDVTGTGRLFGAPQDAARLMYRRIRERFGLAPAWSAAPNKLLSKVATRLVKPSGEYVVKEGEEKGFLAPLPVSLLPGLEAADLERLHDFSLFRVRQVADLGLEDLETVFGKRASLIYDSVRGIDPSPVCPAGQKPLKISASCRFCSPASDFDAARRHMRILAEKIGAELRRRGKAARTMTIALDYADGVRCFRRVSVSPPCSDDITLAGVCTGLFEKAWVRRVRPVRACVACPKPVAPQFQMELFSENLAVREKRNSLVNAVDRIRHRFGSNAVCMGRTPVSS
ncbi:MAG: DNA polymerase Y family protein [Desulfosalsimonas sp.]